MGRPTPPMEIIQRQGEILFDKQPSLRDRFKLPNSPNAYLMNPVALPFSSNTMQQKSPLIQTGIIRYTLHPPLPLKKGRVRVGMMSFYLKRLY
jgi:hypothetical protein